MDNSTNNIEKSMLYEIDYDNNIHHATIITFLPFHSSLMQNFVATKKIKI